MDLSLQPFGEGVNAPTPYCFNPCFNGSFTSTHYKNLLLILVFPVSILVLMDLSLQHIYSQNAIRFSTSFNPCFNGSFTSTIANITPYLPFLYCFNPCFNGSFTSTITKYISKNLDNEFQSLF